MAAFEASGIVEALDYDLRPYADAEGTITEPTSLQVEKFLMASRKEIERARREQAENGGPAPGDDAADLTPEQVLEALGGIDPARNAAARKRNAEIFSALCSGKPTAAQLMKLPHRVMLAFATWITGEVLNPEAAAGAGRPPLEIVRSPAAG